MSAVAALTSGANLVYEGKTYKVKLNGSSVYLIDPSAPKDSKPGSIARVKAEMLWFHQNPSGGAPAVPTVAPGVFTVAQAAAAAAASPTEAEKKTQRVRKPRIRKPRKARKAAAAAVAESASEDKTAQVRAILKEALAGKTDAELDALVNRVRDVFINKDKVGGVYLIRITKIAGQPVQFFDTAAAVGKETPDYVLVKIGRADNIRKRFGQFDFEFDEVLRINGDNTMEAELKRMVPANFSRYFFPAGTTRNALLKLIGLEGNNAPTEWRVMTRKTYDALVAKAAAINSLNWRTELKLPVVLKAAEKSLSLKLGTEAAPRANLVMMEIQ